MRICLDDFNKILEELSAKATVKVSCPMNQNQLCFQSFNNCPKGLADDCHQRFKFSIGKNLYNVEVTYYGVGKNGFIESESVSIRNFVIRNKVDLQKLVSGTQ